MKIGHVKACWDSKYHGVKCLESEDSYGFFKDENDHRPSSCVWVKKNKQTKIIQETLQ
jgi:hypothetical protein